MGAAPYRGAMTSPGDEPPFPDYSPAQLAESERVHRAWLNGEDTAPGAYDDDVMDGDAPTDR